MSKRKYRSAWEAEPAFSGWLTSLAEDDSKAFCKICRCTLQAHKKDIRNHGQCKKHEEAFRFSQQASTSKKITHFMKDNISRERKILELRIAAFICEHCSINTIDHLGFIIKTADKSSLILNEVKIHRTKCTALINNVLSPCYLRSLIEDVGDGTYSMIVDESTSIDTKKMLCIMIRYHSRKSKTIKSQFYRLIEIEAGDANTLAAAFKKQLSDDGLQIEKLVGIGIDGASVMIGARHSFSSILKQTVEDLIVVKCLCHSLHLAAEQSCNLLPRNLDFIVKECHNWFSCSSKRQIEYRLLYQTLTNNARPLKINKLSGTRWLARQEAIDKVLEQWDALKLHFHLAKDKERCYVADQLYGMLNDERNKLYLTFLNFILKPLIRVNKVFQSEDANPLKLLEDVNSLLYSYLRMIVPPQRLEIESRLNYSTFNIKDCAMAAECVNFGYNFNELAARANINKTDINVIKGRCREFLIELCIQLQKRIPENICLLEKISYFSPQAATSQMKPDITDVVVAFKNLCGIDVDTTLNEWNCLHRHEWTDTDTPEKFWTQVSNVLDSSGQQRFGSISKLSLTLLALPFSNASVERAFSVVNIIKDKLRNRMAINTADAIMRVRFSLKENVGGCTSFSPSEDMIKKFNSEDMYVSTDAFEADNVLQALADSSD